MSRLDWIATFLVLKGAIHLGWWALTGENLLLKIFPEAWIMTIYLIIGLAGVYSAIKLSKFNKRIKSWVG